jgi:branched-chain amino acid transport system permease protein
MTRHLLLADRAVRHGDRQSRHLLHRWLAGAVSVAALAALGSFLPAGPLAIATSVLLFVTLAESWNIIGGFAGYPSFGQVMFSGVGGYCAAVLTARAGLWFWAALPASAAFAAAFAAVIGVPLLRLRGNVFSVATLGLAAGTEELVTNLGVTGGAAGLTIPTYGPGPHTAYPGPLVFYWAFLALAALAVAVVAWLAWGRFGLALQAIRTDETAASSVGVATTRIKVAALSLSASLAGAAGALSAFQQVVVTPGPLFDIATTTLIVVMAVVGGRGTILGPVAGALVIGTLETRLPLLAGSPYSLLLPALIITAVILLPDGVLGTTHGGAWSRFPGLDTIRRYRL